MPKYCELIIINYVAIYALNGFFSMLGYPPKLDLLYFIASLPLIYKNITCGRIFKQESINIYFLLIIFYFTFTGFIHLGEYPFSFFYQALRVQIWGMLFFFLGQSKLFADNTFFDKMRIPFLLVFISGIILYFWSPSWYTDWKLLRYDVSTDATKEYAYDFFRLSGFWTLHYFISYGAYIFISYELYKISIHKSDWYTPFLILIAFATLVLAMQRAPLLLSIACFLFYSIFLCFKKGKYKHLRLLYILITIIIVSLLPYILTKFEDIELIMNRMDVLLESDNFFSERTKIFSKAFKYISFFGYGLGRFGSTASQTGSFAITDQEWLRMTCETGIFGVSLFVLFWIIIILKGMKHFKRNIFEFSIIIFILVSMTGANPLGNDGIMHQIIFWICAGRIINRYRIKGFAASSNIVTYNHKKNLS